MPAALEIQSVVKRYAQVEALRGVSLHIEPGEFFGLLGPNGAGKTTLISLVAGLVRADSGRVAVMGYDVVRDFRRARRSLGVVPQELVFDAFFTVRETLRISSGYYGIRRNDDWIDEVLSNLGLLSKADTNMRALSGGMKRRVLVAQALVHRPEVIVLDEPTAGVDVELRHTLWKFVRRLNSQGHTVVLTTHYLHEAEELCGRVAMLRDGEIVALDRTENLLSRFTKGFQLKLRLAEGRLPTVLLPKVQTPDAGDDAGPAPQHDGAVFLLRLNSFYELEIVLVELRIAGCKIGDMSLIQTDLEDVFLQIVSAAGQPFLGAALPTPRSGLS